MAGRLDAGLTPWATRRPLYALLGVFQILAALALVPFTVLTPGAGGDLPAGLAGVAWVGLAAVNLVPRIRPARWTFEIALYAAALVAVGQAAALTSGYGAMLSGVQIAVLALFGVFCLTARRLYAWLGLVSTAFVVAVGYGSPLGAGAAAVSAVLIAVCAVTVRRLVQQVVHAAEHDPLTGALNRLGLRDRADLVRAYADRRSEPTSVALLDIDHFKEYNDRLGHAAGDRLLIDVVAHLQRALRRSDLVARLGGDEFLIVLVGTDEDQAEAALARVLPDLPVRCSLGVTAWTSDTDLMDAIEVADERMYGRRRRIRRSIRDLA